METRGMKKKRIEWKESKHKELKQKELKYKKSKQREWEQEERMRIKKRFCEKLLPLLIVPSIFITDFFVKNYVETYGEQWKGKQVFQKKICLKKHHNTGMAMDLMNYRTGWVLAASSIVLTLLCFFMALVMPKKGRKLIKYGLAFLIGGAAGNVYDRAVRRYVVDYFSFQTGMPWLDRIIFNLSDLCIFAGMILIVIGDIFDRR